MPDWSEVLRETSNLDAHIKSRSAVDLVRPLDRGFWEVRSRIGGGKNAQMLLCGDENETVL